MPPDRQVLPVPLVLPVPPDRQVPPESLELPERLVNKVPRVLLVRRELPVRPDRLGQPV